MPTIERTVRTDQPLDKVFAYLSNFTNAEQWDAGTVSCRRTEGDGGVGSVYQNTSRFLGRETRLEYTVLAVDPQRRFQLRGVNKTVTSLDTMELSPYGDGTEIRYTAEFEFSGVSKYLAPLLAPALKKLGDGAQEGLQRELARL